MTIQSRRTLCAGLCVVVLAIAGPAAGQAEGFWQVTKADGTTFSVSADSVEVTPAGALQFWKRIGQINFVLHAYAPGFWRCARATSLNDGPGNTFQTSYAQGC